MIPPYEDTLLEHAFINKELGVATLTNYILIAYFLHFLCNWFIVTNKNRTKKSPFPEITFLFGASDQIRTDECLVHSQVCWASSPHPPNA